MPNTHRLTPVLGAVVALATGLVASACSMDGAHQEQRAVPSGKPPVPYVVKLTTVTGKLPDAKRAAVRKQAGTVIHNWWDAAYLSSGRTDTFGAFTPGAAKLAKRDADLLSDPSLSDGDITDVVRQRIDLDVLAVGGRVSLVPVSGSWRIFGYDVTHSCGAVPKATPTPTRTPSPSPSGKASR